MRYGGRRKPLALAFCNSYQPAQPPVGVTAGVDQFGRSSSAGASAPGAVRAWISVQANTCATAPQYTVDREYIQVHLPGRYCVTLRGVDAQGRQGPDIAAVTSPLACAQRPGAGPADAPAAGKRVTFSAWISLRAGAARERKRGGLALLQQRGEVGAVLAQERERALRVDRAAVAGHDVLDALDERLEARASPGRRTPSRLRSTGSRPARVVAAHEHGRPRDQDRHAADGVPAGRVELPPPLADPAVGWT